MTARQAITNPARMAIPDVPAGGISYAELPWPGAALVDDMLAAQIDWQQDAVTVADAYAYWCSAPADDEALRFSAYVAALDQEQAAASDYARAVRDLELWLRTHQHTTRTPQRRST